MDYKGIIAL